MKLLIIDDDLTFLRLYEKSLAHYLLENDAIFITPTSENFLEIVKNNSINVIITDLKMPGKSGLDVLQEVKTYNPLIEVLVVTGEGSIDTAVKAMTLGARDFLTKPLNQQLLFERIDTIRDILSGREETEQYRFAKETVELNASDSIRQLEIKLYNCLQALEAIKNIASNQSNSDTENISRIVKIIDTIEKDN